LQTFEIDGLTVAYSVADLSGLPGNALEEGQLLRVIGRLDAADRLVAQSLRLEEEFGSSASMWSRSKELSRKRVHRGIWDRPLHDQSRPGDHLQQHDPTGCQPGNASHGSRHLADRDILADEIFLSEKIRMESNVDSTNLAGNSFALTGFEAATIFATATTRIVGIAQGIEDIVPGDHARVLAGGLRKEIFWRR